MTDHAGESPRLAAVGPLATDGSDFGCMVLRRRPQEDERGSLERLFAADELAQAGIYLEAVHINLTRTIHTGTVKGLHMQMPPHAETKIITCISGRIFDVAVDLRHTSSSYGQWFGIELSPEQPVSLMIPVGFAHGMQSLEPNSIVDSSRPLDRGVTRLADCLLIRARFGRHLARRGRPSRSELRRGRGRRGGVR